MAAGPLILSVVQIFAPVPDSQKVKWGPGNNVVSAEFGTRIFIDLAVANGGNEAAINVRILLPGGDAAGVGDIGPVSSQVVRIQYIVTAETVLFLRAEADNANPGPELALAVHILIRLAAAAQAKGVNLPLTIGSPVASLPVGEDENFTIRLTVTNNLASFQALGVHLIVFTQDGKTLGFWPTPEAAFAAGQNLAVGQSIVQEFPIRLQNSVAQPLSPQPPGSRTTAIGIIVSAVNAFDVRGDFRLVSPAAGPSGGGFNPLLLAAGAVALVAFGAPGILAERERS